MVKRLIAEQIKGVITKNRIFDERSNAKQPSLAVWQYEMSKVSTKNDS